VRAALYWQFSGLRQLSRTHARTAVTLSLIAYLAMGLRSFLVCSGADDLWDALRRIDKGSVTLNFSVVQDNGAVHAVEHVVATVGGVRRRVPRARARAREEGRATRSRPPNRTADQVLLHRSAHPASFRHVDLTDAAGARAYAHMRMIGMAE